MEPIEELKSLLQWCRETPMDTCLHLVEEEDWGFYIENAERGVGGFVWFRTPEDLIHYFANCWGYSVHDEPEEIERDTSIPLKAARYGEYARRFTEEEMSEEQFLAELSAAHPGVVVHWIGQFEDIVAGEEGFPVRWRADFRGSDDLEDGYPIQEDEWEDLYPLMSLFRAESMDSSN